MRTLTTLTLGILITAGGIGLPLVATAEPSTGWEHGRMHEGRMMHDGGKMGGYGARHGFGHSWKASLTDEQSKKVDKLRLSYKRDKYLLKAKLKQAKIEFALLITKDSPSKSSINSKIDQITKLKKEKLHLKANHKINMRKVLTEDQRVKFDLAVLKRMAKGKHGKYRR
jgi:Spy/CpxP family protein refolding chaperone